MFVFFFLSAINIYPLLWTAIIQQCFILLHLTRHQSSQHVTVIQKKIMWLQNGDVITIKWYASLVKAALLVYYNTSTVLHKILRHYQGFMMCMKSILHPFVKHASISLFGLAQTTWRLCWLMTISTGYTHMRWETEVAGLASSGQRKVSVWKYSGCSVDSF